MSSKSVLVIGLDGVDQRYLNSFAEDLPSISMLQEYGVSAPLDSVHPPWTGAAWPSMYTGISPAGHGVYDFFDYSDTYPDSATPVNRSNVDAPAIWNYLSQRGLRSVVLNVPITHPADEIEGVLVPGYLAPPDEEGHPPGIRKEISETIGSEYSIYSENETSDQMEKKIDGFEKLIENRADAAVACLEREQWDFAFVQVQKTDTVFHNSSSEDDFKRIYRAADELVSRVIEICDEDTTIILCSDHGIGPVDGYTVYLNEVLQNHEFVEAGGDSTTPQVEDIKTEGDSSSSESPLVSTLMSAANRIGITPGMGYRVVKYLGIENEVLRFVPDSVVGSIVESVDWQSSRAFCRTTSEQGIRINLEGRDSAGVVTEEEYESVRDEIIEILRELETPEGEPVFEMVCRREELYDGPHVEDSCDILFLPADMNHKISPNLVGETMIPTNIYNHKKTGVFAASSPIINNNAEIESLSLLDIAPIVFACLDLPVPDRFQGSVPEGLLEIDVRSKAYEGIKYGDDEEYTQDQQDVEDRLSDLGYL